ncbi:MAG: histone deacetylase [archaeon]
MDIIYNSIFLEHDTGMHPENRKRLEACLPLPETKLPQDEKPLSLVHTSGYISRVREASKKATDRGARLDPDTVASNGSFQAAVAAVNATILASKQDGFALVRPPGHHAHRDQSSGFCIFNNIAIATQRLVDDGKRVLIFDFDGHLGDGTVDFFSESDRVLYWSIHQHPAFPGGGEADEIGHRAGKGYTICVPLPPGSGDDIFLDAVRSFMPAAVQFNPDVIAISAGFDAHQHDLLLDLRVTAPTYHEIGKTLAGNFGHKPMFATLEGGYNVEEFPRCLFNFIDGINGKPIRYKEEATDSRIIVMEEYQERVAQAKDLLSPYWDLRGGA